MSSFGGGTKPEQENATLRSKRGDILMRDVYEKDKVVFREGQEGTDAFVVESGRIGVFKTIEGKVVRLAVFEQHPAKRKAIELVLE